MKISLVVFATLVIACVEGFPWHFGPTNEFRPCSTVASLQTLWPDFNNNRRFFQCMTINRWGIHYCPGGLLFSFSHQVCVWPDQWRAPPPPDQITPLPTTPWPTRGSTLTQEVTVTNETPTDGPPPLPTLPPPTDSPTTTQGTNTDIPTDETPIDGTTTFPNAPPTPEPTTRGPTPPSVDPTDPTTEPIEPTPQPPEITTPNKPPTPETTQDPDDPLRPPTPVPRFHH